jgi:hypothetical protein
MPKATIFPKLTVLRARLNQLTNALGENNSELIHRCLKKVNTCLHYLSSRSRLETLSRQLTNPGPVRLEERYDNDHVKKQARINFFKSLHEALQLSYIINENWSLSVSEIATPAKEAIKSMFEIVSEILRGTTAEDLREFFAESYRAIEREPWASAFLDGFSLKSKDPHSPLLTKWEHPGDALQKWVIRLINKATITC